MKLLNQRESWAPKNWCFWTVVLEKTLESPVDCKEIQPAHPEGNQSWIFIGRTDAEAETPTLWPPGEKSWLTGKDSDARKDWRQDEKGTTDDEIVKWHHWFDGHEFEQAPGVGDGQASLACCGPCGCKESDKTERLNWKKLSCLNRFWSPLPTTPENYSSKDLDYQQWASLRCSNPKLESLFYSSFFCILSLQAISSSYHLWSLSPGGPVLTTSAVTAWGWQLRPGAALLHFCFWTQQLGSFIIMQIRQVLWLETMNKFPFHLG